MLGSEETLGSVGSMGTVAVDASGKAGVSGPIACWMCLGAVLGRAAEHTAAFPGTPAAIVPLEAAQALDYSWLLSEAVDRGSHV